MCNPTPLHGKGVFPRRKTQNGWVLVESALRGSRAAARQPPGGLPAKTGWCREWRCAGPLELWRGWFARVAVVHHEIGAQPLGGVVIHATRAVRDIAHHDHLCMREVANDIGNSTSVATDEALTKRLHSQTLRKLETDRLRVRLCNSVDRFVYLKVVVGREAVDCLVQGLVVQNLVRNGISPNHRALHSVFGGGGTPQFCP